MSLKPIVITEYTANEMAQLLSENMFNYDAYPGVEEIVKSLREERHTIIAVDSQISPRFTT